MMMVLQTIRIIALQLKNDSQEDSDNDGQGDACDSEEQSDSEGNSDTEANNDKQAIQGPDLEGSTDKESAKDLAIRLADSVDPRDLASALNIPVDSSKLPATLAELKTMSVSDVVTSKLGISLNSAKLASQFDTLLNKPAVAVKLNTPIKNILPLLGVSVSDLTSQLGVIQNDQGLATVLDSSINELTSKLNVPANGQGLTTILNTPVDDLASQLGVLLSRESSSSSTGSGASVGSAAGSNSNSSASPYPRVSIVGGAPQQSPVAGSRRF